MGPNEHAIRKALRKRFGLSVSVDGRVGERVTVKPGDAHDEMTAGKTGTIVEIGTPALGIKFDDMDEIHRWYTAEELESAE